MFYSDSTLSLSPLRYNYTQQYIADNNIESVLNFLQDFPDVNIDLNTRISLLNHVCNMKMMDYTIFDATGIKDHLYNDVIDTIKSKITKEEFEAAFPRDSLYAPILYDDLTHEELINSLHRLDSSNASCYLYYLEKYLIQTDLTREILLAHNFSKLFKENLMRQVISLYQTHTPEIEFKLTGNEIEWMIKFYNIIPISSLWPKDYTITKEIYDIIKKEKNAFYQVLNTDNPKNKEEITKFVLEDDSYYIENTDRLTEFGNNVINLQDLIKKYLHKDSKLLFALALVLDSDKYRYTNFTDKEKRIIGNNVIKWISQWEINNSSGIVENLFKEFVPYSSMSPLHIISAIISSQDLRHSDIINMLIDIVKNNASELSETKRAWILKIIHDEKERLIDTESFNKLVAVIFSQSDLYQILTNLNTNDMYYWDRISSLYLQYGDLVNLNISAVNLFIEKGIDIIGCISENKSLKNVKDINVIKLIFKQVYKMSKLTNLSKLIDPSFSLENILNDIIFDSSISDIFERNNAMYKYLSDDTVKKIMTHKDLILKFALNSRIKSAHIRNFFYNKQFIEDVIDAFDSAIEGETLYSSCIILTLESFLNAIGIDNIPDSIMLKLRLKYNVNVTISLI